MRHLKAGRKLKRTHSHRVALLDNLAQSLFEHKKIATTEAKAKELRPFAESLITKAKLALKREKQGLLPESQKIDVHSRRVVARHIRKKAVVQELFDTIAPMVEERPGGYTRIIKTGFRRGDGGSAAIIELVDWSAPRDGAQKIRGRKKAKTQAQTQPKAAKTAAPAAADTKAPVEEKAPEAVAVEEPIVDTPVAVEESVVEEPAAEAEAEEPKAEAEGEETKEA